MPALSACIEMLFRDRPFIERVPAVAELGIPAVEFWRYGDKDVEGISSAAKDAGLKVAGIVCDTGGPLVDPTNRKGLRDAVADSIAAANTLGCTTMIVTTGQERIGVPRSEQHRSIVDGLKSVAGMVEDAGVTLVLEPLNVLVNHKGYYLATTAEGVEILEEVGSPNVKLLYDIYHQQITEGNLIDTIRENIDWIGHFHLADVPGRNQPGTGEINYDNVLRAIGEADYDGFVGIECTCTVPEKQALADIISYSRRHFA